MCKPDYMNQIENRIAAAPAVWPHFPEPLHFCPDRYAGAHLLGEGHHSP